VLFTRLLAGPRPLIRVARVPGLCAICRAWGWGRVCEDCIARFAAPVPRCSCCALRMPAGTAICGACLQTPPPYARTVTAVDYGHPWDGLITRYKFHTALDLGPTLARLLLAAIAGSELVVPDLALPVPLSARRLRERGYNQAWELAKRVARPLHVATDPALLLRVKDTPHQLALPPAARAGNVRGAFAVEPRRRGALNGCRVALVDDVMTSGATAAEAACTLLQAGATAVDVWVLARTPRPQEA
jgi:ComF family protein